MHLYLALSLHRDYFNRLNASLSCFSVPQGLFRPPECISILPFYPTGIISAAPDASLFCPINDFHDRITKSSKSGGQMPPLRFILSEKYFRCACVPSAGFCANPSTDFCANPSAGLCANHSAGLSAHFFTRTSLLCSVRSPSYP